MRSSRFLIFVGVVIELASIVTTGVSAYLVHQSREHEADARFERQVDRGMQAAANRLQQYEYALIAGAGFFHARGSVSAAEWRAFVDTLEVNVHYPGTSGFGFISRVPADDVDDLVSHMRSQGYEDFAVRVLDTAPPGDRYIVSLIEPWSRNKAAHGLDIASNAVRRAAADAAMLSGRTSITRIITLVQDQQAKPGFLMVVPVYRDRIVPDDIDARRRSLIGWTYAPFVGETTMTGIADVAGKGVRFAIYDGEVSEDRAIYDGIRAEYGHRHEIRAVEVGGLEWLFRWTTDDLDEGGNPIDDDTWWVIITGLLTSTGLLVVMLLLHRSNQRSIERAEHAAQAKSAFLAVMSHEIRTPLNGVIGMTDVLRQGELSREVRKQVDVIHDSGTLLLALVNDILDYSRIESGRLALEREPFQPAALVRECGELMRRQIEGKGLSLTMQVDGDGEWALGDPLRLRQILINFLSNAGKFTKHGGITVRCERSEAWTIHVTDTGIGMEQATVDRLFQPFAQADSSIPRRYGGSGLGLSISKRLVELMGGDISVTSSPGSGSTFTVILDLPPAVAPGSAIDPQIVIRTDFSGSKILLAEDNRVNQLVAATMLSKLGCMVSTAENGEQAVALARQEHFDLILMDCQMPVMDGLDATRALRDHGITVPIIAFTANITYTDRVACDEAGMNGYLSKPLRQDDLARVLEQYLAG